MSGEEAAACRSLLEEMATLTAQVQSMLEDGKLQASQITALMSLLPNISKDLNKVISNTEEEKEEPKVAKKPAKKSDKKGKKSPVQAQHSAPTKIVKVSHCPDVFLSED